MREQETQGRSKEAREVAREKGSKKQRSKGASRKRREKGGRQGGREEERKGGRQEGRGKKRNGSSTKQQPLPQTLRVPTSLMAYDAGTGLGNGPPPKMRLGSGDVVGKRRPAIFVSRLPWCCAVVSYDHPSQLFGQLASKKRAGTLYKLRADALPSHDIGPARAQCIYHICTEPRTARTPNNFRHASHLGAPCADKIRLHHCWSLLRTKTEPQASHKSSK